jgi:predicted nuclease of restriction endonuclease-like RecB superfamily
MLSGELLRALLRAGRVTPRFLEGDSDQARLLASRLLEIFGGCVGQTVAELEAAIEALAAEHPEPILVRGMAKLLHDLTTVGTAATVDPSALRAAVFAEAQRVRPVRPGGGDGFAAREAVIAKVASDLGVRPEDVDAWLFADRPGAQRVTACDLPPEDELAPRYNLALAQGILLRAREVRVVLKALDNKRLRALLAAIKFHRLLVRAEPVGGDGGVRLILDGPMSLQQQTGRYGLQLALMLPHLHRAGPFALEADVTWHRGSARGAEVTLALTEKSPVGGPLSLARTLDRGVWESAEEQHLRAAWEACGTPWRLEPGLAVFDLGGRDVLAPDFRLVHPDGREAWLELFWTWRRSNVGERLLRLRDHAPPNLIVAWARRGGLEGELADLAASGDGRALALYGFKGVIVPSSLIALAETVATVPAVTPAATPAARPKRTRKPSTSAPEPDAPAAAPKPKPARRARPE